MAAGVPAADVDHAAGMVGIVELIVNQARAEWLGGKLTGAEVKEPPSLDLGDTPIFGSRTIVFFIKVIATAYSCNPY